MRTLGAYCAAVAALSATIVAWLPIYPPLALPGLAVGAAVAAIVTLRRRARPSGVDTVPALFAAGLAIVSLTVDLSPSMSTALQSYTAVLILYVLVRAWYGPARAGLLAAVSCTGCIGAALVVFSVWLGPGVFPKITVMNAWIRGIAETGRIEFRDYPGDPLMEIEHVAVAAEGGTIIISGWAIDRNVASGDGIASVDVFTDSGISIGSAATDIDRPDVAQYFGSPQFRLSGWRVVASAGEVKAVYAVAHSSKQPYTTIRYSSLDGSTPYQLGSLNTAAAVLLVPFSYALVMLLRNSLRSWVLLGLVAVAVALLLTGSRNAWFAALWAALLLWLAAKNAGARPMLLIALLFGGVIAAIAAQSTELFDSSSAFARVRIWGLTWDAVRASLPWGLGPGRLAEQLAAVPALGGRVLDPHSTVLQALSDAGVLGVCSIALAAVFALCSVSARPQQPVGHAAAIALCAYLAFGVADSTLLSSFTLGSGKIAHIASPIPWVLLGQLAHDWARARSGAQPRTVL